MYIAGQSKDNHTLLKKIQVGFFIIAFLIISITICAQRVRAASFPRTSITHKPGFSVQANGWLSVDVSVTDPAGIEEVRCYFRYDASLPFVFVKMQKASGTTFRGALPPPAEQTEEIEYLFMVVNRERQAVLSKSFQKSTTAGRITSSEVLAEESFGPLFFETGMELAAIDSTITADQDRTAYVRVEKTRRFGIIAGLYSRLQLDVEVKEGYFGAFRQDTDGGMVSLKGFVVAKTKNETDLQLSSGRMSGIGALEKSDAEMADAAAPPTVAGNNWRGEFWRSDDYAGTVISVTASITQDADGHITITTSKEDIGHHLSGTLFNDGNMFLYDSFDNEDWTTHYGPASDTYIKIADFVRPPTISDPRPPLHIIELTRKSIVEPVVIEPLLHLLLGK